MQGTASRFNETPRTKPGRWAVGLAIASIPLMLLWSVLPGGALLSFLCGLAGGILALTTIIRRKERSWLLFLAILPLLNVLFFLFGEFLFPH